MNITNNTIALANGKITGTIDAVTTSTDDCLCLDVPIHGLDLTGWGGKVTVDVSTGVPGVPMSGWAWMIGTSGGGFEFEIVVPPSMDKDSDGDVDGADLGIILNEITAAQATTEDLGILLAEWGLDTNSLGAIDVYAVGVGNGKASGSAVGGTVTPYKGDGAFFRVQLPVVSAKLGAVLKVTVNVTVNAD